MKNSLLLLIPFSMFAGSFEDLEKDLFGSSDSESPLKEEKQDSSKEVSVNPESLSKLINDDDYNFDEDEGEDNHQTLMPNPYNPKIASTCEAPDKPIKIKSHHPYKARWLFEGSGLYMKPYFSNLPYLFTNDLSDYIADGNGAATSNIQPQTIGANWGFDVYGSYQTNWIDAMITAGWLRFYTKSSQTTYNITDFGTDGYLTPLAIDYFWNSDLTEPYNFETLQSYTANATGTVNLNIDLFEFMFRFPYKTKKHATFTPAVGAKGLLFLYTSHINRLKNYNGETPALQPPFNQNKVFLKERFNAVGPSVAFEGNVNLGSRFSFNALAQASAVFGYLKAYNNSKMYEPDLKAEINLNSSNYTFKPLLDLRMGFAWNKVWAKSGITLEAGYDFHYMPNLMQIPNQQTNLIWRSDLSTQGVYGSLGVDF